MVLQSISEKGDIELYRKWEEYKKVYNDCESNLISVTVQDGCITYHLGGAGFGLPIIHQYCIKAKLDYLLCHVSTFELQT